MGIITTQSKIHWNYFLALEKELEVLSRYVELREENFETFSIQLAHLLFAASSEVEVVLKLLCERIDPENKKGGIENYRAIITSTFTELPHVNVYVSRYGLELIPWDQWKPENKGSPLWWRGYNKVKHKRDEYFHEATLKNVLNALSALLVTIIYYHAHEQSVNTTRINIKETIHALDLKSELIKLGDEYYYSNLVV